MHLTALRTCLSGTVLALLLAACAQQPTGGPATAASAPAAAASAPTAADTAGKATAPAPPERDPNPSGTAAKLALAAVDLLETGNEEQAAADLKRALGLDPSNKLAQSLNRQMTEDPVARFGRESFPYVVKSGDTLSRIAGRFLGDIYLFHALARYNNIKVPRQVGEGQTLRIPGKAPPPELAKPAVAADNPAAEASPAQQAFRGGQAAEKAGDLDRAYSEYKTAANQNYPGAGVALVNVRKKLVDKHSKAARTALARQNLDGAIEAWDQVLALKPGDETALLERQKVLRLKEALSKK
jgi:tetratricopeptide (TPR) repeat protein